jgi:23S rRNA (adenine2503-C2)-methyltransferase
LRSFFKKDYSKTHNKIAKMQIVPIKTAVIKADFREPQFLSTSNFSIGAKTNLIGLSFDELKNEMQKIGEKPFCTRQIWNWIYAKGVNNFALMSNISLQTRQKLEQDYSIKRATINQDLLSSDGTRKWLIKFSDCKEVEMVFIPEDNRGTLCISSQIGCTLTCKFCHTGTQLLVRNLSAGEIVAQLMLARDLLGDWQNDKHRQVTSIVFMGMGEPLFNYDNVKKAVEILNDNNGINFSKRKITISTSGVVPEIIRFADEIKTVLAISLHATDDETRSKIMPLNKKYPITDLMQACKYYMQNNPTGRITFEYVMLAGINDSDENARNLVRILKTHQLPALINLIPFNPWVGTQFTCSSRNRIMAFGRIIKNAGYAITIRKTRGDDVMAACGQLKSDSQKKTSMDFA